MSENKKIEIMQSVYDKNDEVASKINLSLTKKGIYAINVMGSRSRQDLHSDSNN